MTKRKTRPARNPEPQKFIDDPIDDGADPDNPVVLAAKAVGSFKKLAELMGMSPQGIQKMKKTRVIDVRVLQLERVSGISRHRIRPDLYPIEECPNCGYLIGASEQVITRASHSKNGRGTSRHAAR